MKKALGLGVIFALMAGLVMAQQKVKPYSYTFKKGFGTCVFTNVTVEQAWTAATTVLKHLKWDLTEETNEASGLMVALSSPSFVQNTPRNYKLSLRFEQNPNGVKVSAKVEDVWVSGGGNALYEALFANSGHEHIEKSIYNKMAEALYGKGK